MAATYPNQIARPASQAIKECARPPAETPAGTADLGLCSLARGGDCGAALGAPKGLRRYAFSDRDKNETGRPSK